MYVICFYWNGDRWSPDIHDTGNVAYNNHLHRIGTVDDELAVRYINNLYNGVKRFASREFTFVCFTNENLNGVDDNVELRSFPMVSRRGVLPRVYMFSQDADLGDSQVLCLDLDVVIVGDLDPLMSYDGEFCTRAKFKRGEQHKIDGDIMSFKAGKQTHDRFYKPFIDDTAEAERITQGRERYWIRHVAGDVDLWQKIRPGAVVSYKWHVKRSGRLPERAAIVSCHGKPRPHQISQPWINEYWNFN